MHTRRDNPVQVKLNDAELARLDELRGSSSRPAFLRCLLRAPPDSREVATHEEALAILSAQARDGGATAAVALERALREDVRPESPDDQIADILGWRDAQDNLS
jgi:hypothetical protein